MLGVVKISKVDRFMHVFSCCFIGANSYSQLGFEVLGEANRYEDWPRVGMDIVYAMSFIRGWQKPILLPQWFYPQPINADHRREPTKQSVWAQWTPSPWKWKGTSFSPIFSPSLVARPCHLCQVLFEILDEDKQFAFANTSSVSCVQFFVGIE